MRGYEWEAHFVGAGQDRRVPPARAQPIPASTGVKALRAADGIIEARRGVALGGLKINDFVNEGRQ